MNLIQWLLTLPIRDAVREKNRLRMKEDISEISDSLKAINYNLRELVEMEKRGERLGAVLEERESGGYADLESRLRLLEGRQSGLEKIYLDHAHANLEKRLATLEQALWPTTVTTPNTDAKQE